MPKYTVLVKEVHYTPVTIEADSPRGAIEAVREGDGEFHMDRMEFSHTEDPGEWKIGLENDKGFTGFTQVDQLED